MSINNFACLLTVVGFNYAYRRTATTTTPSSATPALSSAQVSKGSTPAPTNDKPIPPHFINRSQTPTSPIPTKDLAKGTPSKANGTGASTPNTTAQSDKADKERQKKKEKKDRRERERVERDAKESEHTEAPAKADESTPVAGPKSGKATPVNTPTAPSPVPDTNELKSPATESTGTRTPTSKRAPRNPWTIFMRMNSSSSANESEIREFFGDAKDGIVKINCPPNFAGKTRGIAYIEFGDEEAMKAGLEKHAEVRKKNNLATSWSLRFLLQKLKDTIPEVKQATPLEERYPGGIRGGPSGRGRGRGGYAARGLAAAGLTKGTPRQNGGSSSPAPGGDN